MDFFQIAAQEKKILVNDFMKAFYWCMKSEFASIYTACITLNSGYFSIGVTSGPKNQGKMGLLTKGMNAVGKILPSFIGVGVAALSKVLALYGVYQQKKFLETVAKSFADSNSASDFIKVLALSAVQHLYTYNLEKGNGLKIFDDIENNAGDMKQGGGFRGSKCSYICCYSTDWTEDI